MADDRGHDGATDGIHLPGPSLVPLVMSIGIALSLAGLVPESRLYRLTIVSLGATIAIAAGYVWLRDAIREYDHLPD